MAADQGILDSVANSNAKTFGDGPAFFLQLAMGDAVAHQRSMNAIREAATAAAIKQLVEVDPSEAVAALKVTSGNEVASQLTALLAALASGQQQVKTAQTTPPPSGA